MSTHEHDLVAARFASLTPRALPGDWDDVLDRSGAFRPRRRRPARSLWRGGRRRKLVAALAVALLVPVVAAAAYGTVRVLILQKGFIGLPPVGATPSAPDSGEVVLSWRGKSETHRRRHWRGGFLAPYVGVWIYADGRMIWWRDGHVPEGANELTSGYLEQRLTPEGVELLRSEVIGLLERSRALLETVPSDDDPRDPYRSFLSVPDKCRCGGGYWGLLEVRDSDRLVRLAWSAIGGRGRPDFEGTIATPEQLSDLRRIDTLLTDPASVLPSSAWAVREVRAYVPSHYAVCMHSVPPKDASGLLALLPPQAADALRDKSLKPLPVRLGGSVATYCSKLTTEEGREVANAVSGLEQEGWAKPYSLVYRVAEGTHSWERTIISFDPYFPHGHFLLWGGGR